MSGGSIQMRKQQHLYHGCCKISEIPWKKTGRSPLSIGNCSPGRIPYDTSTGARGLSLGNWAKFWMWIWRICQNISSSDENVAYNVGIAGRRVPAWFPKMARWPLNDSSWKQHLSSLYPQSLYLGWIWCLRHAGYVDWFSLNLWKSPGNKKGG